MATSQHGVARRDATQAQPRPIVPPVDVYENADEFLLVADVPGITQDGLSIELDRGELRVTGQRVVAEHGKTLEAGPSRRDYQRLFTVPDGIDADKVQAELKHGVLTVRLPKAPTVKPRKISVAAA